MPYLRSIQFLELRADGLAEGLSNWTHLHMPPICRLDIGNIDFRRDIMVIAQFDNSFENCHVFRNRFLDSV